MLLTAEHIVTAASRMTPDTAFGSSPYSCSPIARIYCVDGTSISVQAHRGSHCKFSDVKPDDDVFSWYPITFGKDLIMAETDCPDLYQFGIDTIEDIESYVESHGGIDVEATTSHAVENAIKALKPYTS